jgi:plasmid stability protein
MALVNLNIRHLPDQVHAVLVRRASARGMSLRAYVVEVLSSHCSLPTTDEWLADLEELPTAGDERPAAAAVRAEREERDDEVARAAAGR